MMDKGLSIREAEDFISSSGQLTDLVKLGFGTSFITNQLKEKIKLYQEANLRVYLGGTLFEAFVARGMFNDYCKILEYYNLDTAEVSDGDQYFYQQKRKYIKELNKNFTVLSEVGSKDANKLIAPYKWIELMTKEIEAGSGK